MIDAAMRMRASSSCGELHLTRAGIVVRSASPAAVIRRIAGQGVCIALPAYATGRRTLRPAPRRSVGHSRQGSPSPAAAIDHPLAWTRSIEGIGAVATERRVRSARGAVAFDRSRPFAGTPIHRPSRPRGSDRMHMKVFIQVPCLNEEETLSAVLESIPAEIEGVDELEILVIDDGSTDRTLEVAREHGVRHFVHHTRNMGLARSFRDGVDYALSHGADIVVNTDGDNQYPQDRIGDLVQPILTGAADIVIADRQTHTIEHFSVFKKVMQRLGSHVVNRAASTELPDAASGFRAYSRAALLRRNSLTQFSYTMETIIQAGNKRLKIASVPVVTNPKTRESRLFK